MNLYLNSNLGDKVEMSLHILNRVSFCSDVVGFELDQEKATAIC